MGDAVTELEEQCLFKLRDVLYVPGAAFYLFSVHSATKEDAQFRFYRACCDIVCNGRVVAAAPVGADGAYSLYDQSAHAVSAHRSACASLVEPAALLAAGKPYAQVVVADADERGSMGGYGHDIEGYSVLMPDDSIFSGRVFS